MTDKKKILVADDDRFAREMLRVILSKQGYELVFAADGAEAVNLAAVEKPDLVITDGLLPKLHGFVVCKTLKSWEDPPKVVLLTAVYTKPTYRWEVKKEYGADDLLSKPVKADALIACIRKHLGEGETQIPGSEPAVGDNQAAAAMAQAASSGAEFAPLAVAAVADDPQPREAEIVTGFTVLPAA